MDNQDEIKPEPSKIKSTAQRAPKLIIDSLAKPQVEGINAPKITKPAMPLSSNKLPGLTDQEKKLVLEDTIPKQEKITIVKLMPESVIQREAKKPSRVKETVIIIIILLALIFGGYQAYIWSLNKQNKIILPPKQEPTGNSANGQNTTITTPPTSASSTTTTTTLSTLPIATLSPATTAPSAIIHQLKINKTPTGYLNVRSEPSPSGKLITQIHPGETYNYIDKKTGWYNITLTDGSSGWVSSQYVAVQ